MEQRKNNNKGGGARIEVPIMNIELLRYYQECNENVKSLKEVTQNTKCITRIDDDNMFDAMIIVLDVVVDLVLQDLEILKYFSILQSSDI